MLGITPILALLEHPPRFLPWPCTAFRGVLEGWNNYTKIDPQHQCQSDHPYSWSHLDHQRAYVGHHSHTGPAGASS